MYGKVFYWLGTHAHWKRRWSKMTAILESTQTPPTQLPFKRGKILKLLIKAKLAFEAKDGSKSGVSSKELQEIGRNSKDGYKQWAFCDIPSMGWIVPWTPRAETEPVFISRYSLFSFIPCFPWEEPTCPPQPQQQSLTTPCFLSLFSRCLLPLEFHSSWTGMLGGRLGSLAWTET